MLKRLEMFALFGAMAMAGHLAGQTVPISPQKQGIVKPGEGQNTPSRDVTEYANRDPPQSTITTSRPPIPTYDEVRQQDQQNLDIQRKMEWFTGLLAFIGALQGLILLLTWKTIARQANLQKFLTKQWVDVGNWKIQGEDAWEVAWDRDPQTEKSRTLKESMLMSVGFELFNRTAYPLTIDNILISIGKLKSKKWIWQVFEDKAHLIMPPKSSDGDNSEECSVPFEHDEDEVFRYTKNCLYLRIHVKVFYLDSEGKRISQDFAREAIYGERESRFYKYSTRQIRKIDRPKKADKNTECEESEWPN